jgi:hypothetical protein
LKRAAIALDFRARSLSLVAARKVQKNTDFTLTAGGKTATDG